MLGIRIGSLCYLLLLLKILAPVFQPLKSKTKNNGTPCAHDFCCSLSKLQIIVKISDWFMVLFAPVVILQGNYFGIGFSTVI